jgi:hypothetical protein
MSNWKNMPDNTEGYHGFVYKIYNNHPDSLKKYYIGCKKLLKRLKRKPLKGKKRPRISYVDNDVEKYWGSSEELKRDIETYGLECFSKEILHLCETQWEMKFLEMFEQMKHNVLFDNQSYNGIINVRINSVPKSLQEKYKNFDFNECAERKNK